MQQVVGVNLQSGCNASLTSREAGDLGEPDGQKKSPVQTTTYERECRTALGHIQKVEYITFLTVKPLVTVTRSIPMAFMLQLTL